MDTDDDQPLTGERLRGRLGGNGAQAQFIRFAAVGGVANVLYGVVFVLLAGLGSQPANLAGALASSALANELHRRLTFRASGRVTWLRAQWEGGGLAGAGMVATSAALAWWDALAPGGGALAHLAVVAVVTGAVGLLRFAALRRVFRARAADSRPDRQQEALLPGHGSPPGAALATARDVASRALCAWSAHDGSCSNRYRDAVRTVTTIGPPSVAPTCRTEAGSRNVVGGGERMRGSHGPHPAARRTPAAAVGVTRLAAAWWTVVPRRRPGARRRSGPGG